MADAPTATERPVKFWVASGLKAASSRSNCFYVDGYGEEI